MAHNGWDTLLEGRLHPDWAEEIDQFEAQMELRLQEKIDEKVFAETRLRRGVYGQRYDNGKRHDGFATRELPFEDKPTKGPDTVWDAPGMQRIKLPFGGLSPEQLEVVADLAEEYSDEILHVTTRQDFQLHFIHIEDTPDLMRRLASVGVTTREACGNSVRNVTACPYAGVCGDSSFDVTPYAHALTFFLLGHKDAQDFGRKLKIAFSGCRDHACGLTTIHDIGCIATERVEDGRARRGFEFWVGGGLGAVPHKAQLLYEFLPEDELLPTSQAVCRVFARLGEKKNRNKARLKFLVAKLGLEEFRRLVDEERTLLPPDDRWTAYLDDLGVTDEAPLKAPARLEDGDGVDHGEGFARWRRTNVVAQAQEGYATAVIRLPLGDITSAQTRALVDLAREHCGDTARTTVEQNILYRWIPEADLPAFYRGLERLGLAEAGAATIQDITACPGTDTCKLGISASRGLAGVLEERLAAKAEALDDDVRKLRIKTSGCFNSCGQHHIADIGFLGVSRNVGGRRVSHFQLVVGGQWTQNGASYGLAVGAFPSKRIPELVDRLTEYWIAEREPGERFQAFIKRAGRAKLKKALDDLRPVPTYEEDPSFYTDWGDAREYTIGDMGVGECAGEVVTLAEFGLAASEREVFEAQLHLEQGSAAKAAELAYTAMLSAAQGLVKQEYPDVSDVPDDIVREFRARLHDTELFHDPFAGAKFASYLFKTHDEPPNAGVSEDEARRHIEEAQLFIEASHACYDRMQSRQVA